jgi:hypothetical protein
MLCYAVCIYSPQVSVGASDMMRIKPWSFVEVGDSVECKPEGQVAT